MHAGTLQVKRGSAPVNRSTTLSPRANSKSQKSPPRVDADRNKSKGSAASGCSAARPSSGTAGRRTTCQPEEHGRCDGANSTIMCSGVPRAGDAGGEKDVGAGANRRISTDSMRGDLRVKADQINFDQVKFDSAKFEHQAASGSKAVHLWAGTMKIPPRRAILTGSSTGSSRVQSITTKSSTSYVAEPRKQIGHASVTSSSGHASVTTSKPPPATASGTAHRPAQSSVVVVPTKNRREEGAAVISSSDSVVRPSAGVLRLLNPASKVHESPSDHTCHLSTVPPATVAGHGLQSPEVYGKVCRKESGPRTQEAKNFRQVCSSASYTLVLDRLQGKRWGERSGDSRGAAGHHPQRSDANCKQETVTSEVESVSGEPLTVASFHESVSRVVDTVASEVETVVTEPENATSEPEQALEAADLKGREGVLEDDGERLPEDNAIVCDPSLSSLNCHSPSEATEFHENCATDSSESDTGSESGAATMKARCMKPVYVNETSAVDHFRSRWTEERMMTSHLKRQLGAVCKDLAKSKRDLRREEELRTRTEEWAEYLERELESYVRSRAEVEKRYLNLLHAVRGIDRFTKQLLHKYITLHRKVETNAEKLPSDCPSKIRGTPQKAENSAAAATEEEEVQGDATSVTAEAAALSDTRPLSTSENDQPDPLSDDEYDFIAKYLKASSSLPETNADVDTAGLFPEADDCDAEANWSCNNFESFRDAARSFDETGRTEEESKSIEVLESEDVDVAENDGEHVICAGDNRKLKTFDVRLRRLSKFFDQVILLCRQKPESYFKVLEDRSCCHADEKKRRNFRSEKQRCCQDGDFLHVRSHGAGDIAKGSKFEREKVNSCREHVASESEDEANWEEKEKERKLREDKERKLREDKEEEEEEEVEEIDKKKKQEEKKQEEKMDESKLKSMSSDNAHASPSSVATKAEEEKAPMPSPKEDRDRQLGAETGDKGQREETEAGGSLGDKGVAPTGVQMEYVNRLLREMCYYCDRYRPGDRAAGLKAFLRDTIETEFLSKQVAQ